MSPRGTYGYGECAVCGRSVALRKDGTIGWHGRTPTMCSGVGALPGPGADREENKQMSADPLCFCGHRASMHAPKTSGGCGGRRCKCTEYWEATRPPQPPPQPGCVAVWPLVIEEAPAAGVSPALIAAMRERDEFGRRKYGVPLATYNGRDAFLDLGDELLDAVVYARQWAAEATDRVERARRGRLYRLVLALADTLFAERQSR